MWRKLLGLNSMAKTTRDAVVREVRLARKLFERAMARHGVNSEEANFWANKLDEAEAKMNS